MIGQQIWNFYWCWYNFNEFKEALESYCCLVPLPPGAHPSRRYCPLVLVSGDTLCSVFDLWSTHILCICL